MKAPLVSAHVWSFVSHFSLLHAHRPALRNYLLYDTQISHVLNRGLVPSLGANASDTASDTHRCYLIGFLHLTQNPGFWEVMGRLISGGATVNPDDAWGLELRV